MVGLLFLLICSLCSLIYVFIKRPGAVVLALVIFLSTSQAHLFQMCLFFPQISPNVSNISALFIKMYVGCINSSQSYSLNVYLHLRMSFYTSSEFSRNRPILCQLSTNICAHYWAFFVYLLQFPPLDRLPAFVHFYLPLFPIFPDSVVQF